MKTSTKGKKFIQIGASNKSTQKLKKSANDVIYYCIKKGHYACHYYKCNKKQPQGKKHPNNVVERKNFEKPKEIGALITSLAIVEIVKDAWYIDSNSTKNMTRRKEWFKKFEPTTLGDIKFGNDRTLEIEGKGDCIGSIENGGYL